MSILPPFLEVPEPPLIEIAPPLTPLPADKLSWPPLPKVSDENFDVIESFESKSPAWTVISAPFCP